MGGGAGFLQSFQALALGLDLGLALAILGEHHGVGVDDEQPALAVDDQELAFADGLERVVQADDRRDRERARDDRGVRGDAADVGDEAAVTVALEEDHVGGRQIVRHHDQLLLLRHRRLGDGLRAHQRLQHALHRVLHVGLALAQVGIVDLVEALDQALHLLHQRPFGVRAPAADQLARRLRQRRVVEDHAVQIEECLELLRRVGRDVRLEILQLLLRGLHRALEARELGVDRFRRELVVRDLQPRGRHQVRVAHRDAAGHGMAVQDEVHSPSPKRSAISLVSAASAASASAPLASIFTVEPLPAASIITPMMLFAFTRRPLRDSQISL